MKMRLALAAAALALMGTTSAQASKNLDVLKITFTGAAATPLGTTEYGGTISNPTGSDVFFYSDSLTGDPSNTAFDLISDPDLSPIPDANGYKLGPGDSYHNDDLFELFKPAGGIYALYNPEGNRVGIMAFNAAGFNAVPEPGSVALLIGTAMSGLLVARRRRK